MNRPALQFSLTALFILTIVDPFSQEQPIVADRNETGVSGEGRYTDDVPDPQ